VVIVAVMLRDRLHFSWAMGNGRKMAGLTHPYKILSEGRTSRGAIERRQERVLASNY
jgi:hypothetical protein